MNQHSELDATAQTSTPATKQTERYHQRRARGVCSLCPRRVEAEADGRQRWACRKCRIRLAAFQRARRARQQHASVMVLNDGRMFDVTDALSDPAVMAHIRANVGEIRSTLHLCVAGEGLSDGADVQGARAED